MGGKKEECKEWVRFAVTETWKRQEGPARNGRHRWVAASTRGASGSRRGSGKGKDGRPSKHSAATLLAAGIEGWNPCSPTEGRDEVLSKLHLIFNHPIVAHQVQPRRRAARSIPSAFSEVHSCQGSQMPRLNFHLATPVVLNFQLSVLAVCPLSTEQRALELGSIRPAPPVNRMRLLRTSIQFPFDRGPRLHNRTWSNQTLGAASSRNRAALVPVWHGLSSRDWRASGSLAPPPSRPLSP
jgi:hypothetical protein